MKKPDHTTSTSDNERNQYFEALRTISREYQVSETRYPAPDLITEHNRIISALKREHGLNRKQSARLIYLYWYGDDCDKTPRDYRVQNN